MRFPLQLLCFCMTALKHVTQHHFTTTHNYTTPILLLYYARSPLATRCLHDCAEAGHATRLTCFTALLLYFVSPTFFLL